MGYYDNDGYYDDYYEKEDIAAPISLIGEGFSEEALTDVILSAGLTPDNRPKYNGNMEKLVFMYGEDSEVYSSAEIQFIESIENVIVYQDFTKKLLNGTMVCRTITAHFDLAGHDALRACVSFEKIIDKALDGFNIFFFVTEDNVFFGCRAFDKTGKKDCALSNPFTNEREFEQLIDEFRKRRPMKKDKMLLAPIDITDDVVVIKINKSYYLGMSALELYDVTRGCWRRRIESVANAKYAFATFKGDIVEVFKIDYWCHASELNRETVDYNPERHWNRIGFFGSVADEKVREKFIGKSVKDFYKWGEADPVKLIRAYKQIEN